MLATRVPLLARTDFPLASMFLFLSHFLPFPKYREKPHSCACSPKKVFHTLIRSAKKKKNYIYIELPLWDAPLAGLSWGGEKQRHLEEEALFTWAGRTAINAEPASLQGNFFLAT